MDKCEEIEWNSTVSWLACDSVNMLYVCLLLFVCVPVVVCMCAFCYLYGWLSLFVWVAVVICMGACCCLYGCLLYVCLLFE